MSEKQYSDGDTFKTLKRTPFLEARALLMDCPNDRDEFLKKHGWILADYMTELKAHYKRRENKADDFYHK